MFIPANARAGGLHTEPTMKKLVLLRHGQSTWNEENRFTGWTDVDLTERGIREATESARLLAEDGYTFDVATTVVPEPSSFYLTGCCLLSMLAWCNSRRRIHARSPPVESLLPMSPTSALFGRSAGTHGM